MAVRMFPYIVSDIESAPLYELHMDETDGEDIFPLSILLQVSPEMLLQSSLSDIKSIFLWFWCQIAVVALIQKWLSRYLYVKVLGKVCQKQYLKHLIESLFLEP